MTPIRKHFREVPKPFLLLILIAGMVLFSSCSGTASKEIDTLRQQVWKKPDDAEAWFRLGNAYARYQQYPKAEEAYRKALAVNPAFEKVFPALGATCFNQGNYPDALVYFKKYQALSPDDSLRNYDLGNVFLQMQEYGKAIDAYRRSVANSISFDEAYYNLGICYIRTGRQKEAEEIYELLVKKNNYLAVSLKNHFKRADTRER
jgi:tetratricopeptide (TPR) repeat protein